MKRFIVEQLGSIQVEASRRFLVEVPDTFTEEQVEQLLHREDVEDVEEIEWTDDADRNWIGYDVAVEETEVYEADAVVGGPRVEELAVVKVPGPIKKPLPVDKNGRPHPNYQCGGTNE